MLEAQKEIRKLTEIKAEQKGEIEKLEAVNGEIKKEKIKVDATVEKQEKDLEDKMQTVLDWKKKNERLEYDLEALREKLNETTEGHRIRIKGELEREFGVKIIELEKALKLKNLDIENLEEKNLKKEKEIQELRAKLKYKNTQLVEFNKFLMETIKKTKKENEGEDDETKEKDPIVALMKGKNKKVDVEAERADDVATLINQNKAILKELVKVKTLHSLLKDDHEYLKKNYEDSRSKKEKMAAELLETKGMYNEFKEQNMFYKRELEARTKKLKVLRDEVKFLERKLETAAKENENLYNVIKGIRGGEYDTNDVVSKMKANVEAKIEENRQLTLALELRDKQIKQLKKKLEEHEITISGAIDMSQYNTNVNNDLDFDDPEGVNLVPFNPAMTFGRNEKDALMKKMDQLREHNNDLKTLLSAKTGELEKKEKALKRAKEELEALQKLNRKGNEDNMKMDENLEELEKVLKKRNKEIESLENQVGILQQRSREMGDKIELFEKENLKLRTETTEKDGEMVQLESELREKTQKLRELGVNV